MLKCPHCNSENLEYYPDVDSNSWVNHIYEQTKDGWKIVVFTEDSDGKRKDVTNINVGDIYYIPNECFEWVIDVDEYCCDVEWDNTCDYLYDYCADGWSGPTDIQNHKRLNTDVYPNPTKGNIYFSKFVNVHVYNSQGALVNEYKNINSLYLNVGIYHLIIDDNNIKFNRTIIRLE